LRAQEVAEICQLAAEVFGLRTQPTDYQQEARQRLHLSFDLLNDEPFAFTDALALPSFNHRVPASAATANTYLHGRRYRAGLLSHLHPIGNPEQVASLPKNPQLLTMRAFSPKIPQQLAIAEMIYALGWSQSDFATKLQIAGLVF